MGNASGRKEIEELEELEELEEIEEIEEEYISNAPFINSLIDYSDMGYEYLVFSGGDINGISYCGALRILELYKIYPNKIKGYAGTSIGAYVAGLLAVGYNILELGFIMKEMDTDKLFDGKLQSIRDGENLINSYGVASGKFIYESLGLLIKEKTGDPDYTINQLYLDKKIKLIIVGTDLNISKSRYFYPTSPIEADRNISIRKAIRISMSIPYIFEPIKHLNHLHVDGGILNNYPIHVFDGEYPGDPQAATNNCNLKVLGLKIISDVDNSDPIKITSLLDYNISFIRTLMMEHDQRILTKSHETRTITIIIPDCDMTNYFLTTNDKNELIKQGELCAIKYFKSDLI